MTKVFVLLRPKFFAERNIAPDTFVTVYEQRHAWLLHLRTDGKPLVTIFALGAMSDLVKKSHYADIENQMLDLLDRVGEPDLSGVRNNLEGRFDITDWTTNPNFLATYSAMLAGVKRRNPLVIVTWCLRERRLCRTRERPQSNDRRLGGGTHRGEEEFDKAGTLGSRGCQSASDVWWSANNGSIGPGRNRPLLEDERTGRTCRGQACAGRYRASVVNVAKVAHASIHAAMPRCPRWGQAINGRDRVLRPVKSWPLADFAGKGLLHGRDPKRTFARAVAVRSFRPRPESMRVGETITAPDGPVLSSAA